MNIFILDDETKLCELMRVHLKKLKYSVTWTTFFDHAVYHLSQTETIYNLFILDVYLQAIVRPVPGDLDGTEPTQTDLGGLELAKIVRNLRRQEGAKILFITGSDLVMIANYAADLGAEAMTKEGVIKLVSKVKSMIGEPKP